MLPPAEDNYGIDSCSIHVMKTNPSIVVIATATGRVHHCISLWTRAAIDDVESLDSVESQVRRLSRNQTR